MEGFDPKRSLVTCNRDGKCAEPFQDSRPTAAVYYFGSARHHQVQYTEPVLLILAFARERRNGQKIASGRRAHSRDSFPGISRTIASVCRSRRAVRYGQRLSSRTANLEAAPTCNKFLDEGCSRSLVEIATARLTCRGQDVEPLHHADILVSEDVAMHDKAPGGNRIEVSPKGNRS